MIKRFLAAVLVLMLCACSAEEAVPTQSIGLTGVGNARELGGYSTEDGRTVKRGVLLRTASLENATEEDIQRLRDDFHLSVVVGLRMEREIEDSPDPEIEGVRNIHIGIIDEEAMEPKPQGSSPEGSDSPEDADSPEGTEELDMSNKFDQLKMAIEEGLNNDHMYVEWLSSAAGKAGYARLFRELIDLPEGEALLFHCSQGKDRTGCAAMLILSALGVDEDTTIEDYLLTNTFNADLIESERQTLAEMGYEDDELDRYIAVLDGVDPQNMVAALEWMKENNGSPIRYILDELGVTEAEIDQLRDKYLDGKAK